MLNTKCINNKPFPGNEVGPPLELNKDYQVRENYKCACGLDHYNVGLKSQYNWISCRKCGEKLPMSDEIHWCSPERFDKQL